VVMFLIWARVERHWPFSPLEIHEEFREPAPTMTAPTKGTRR